MITGMPAKLTSQQSPIQPLLTEFLGFAIAAEMKSHLLLQNFLHNLGVSEDTAQQFITEQEIRSRQTVETTLLTIQQIQSQKETK